MQKDNVIVPFFDGHVEIADSRQRFLQLRQFMVMRGEQRPGSNGIMNVLDDGPRQARAIVGARAAANLVKNNQTAIGGRVENSSRFDHLDHEGTLATREFVAGSDSGENAIGYSNLGALGRYKTAQLTKQV